jgi:hypothetical protein
VEHEKNRVEHENLAWNIGWNMKQHKVEHKVEDEEK